LKRRLENLCKEYRVETLSELIPLVIHDKTFFGHFLKMMSVTVTEMFRDPSFFAVFNQRVIPLLKTFPFVKIWHAGCATGEEVYSTAILLHEASILKTTQIYATDYNNLSLKKAKEGIYDNEALEKYERNYRKVGSEADFDQYFISRYEASMVKEFLKKKVVFSNHNLVHDQVFSETHLIMCRNVLIYFNKELQDHVLGLFHRSLMRGGFLCLGMKETLPASFEEKYKKIDSSTKIYQKIKD
jgi:chemotaxis protein methyltransferase CheR